MKRKIITIDESLCDGCGSCVSTCSEGALQLVDGKARLVKEDFCDGFGDCIGECPTGALKIEERESRPFDIGATREYLFKSKGEDAVLRMEKAQQKHEPHARKDLPCGCPGALAQVIDRVTPAGPASAEGGVSSQLRNWPVQIHLLPLKAPYYQGADLLIAADCCAYAYAAFHTGFIKGRCVAIGCPKLDNARAYEEKLAAIIKENDIRTISVVFMEVPCCSGLVKLAEEAVAKSGKDLSVKKTMIGIRGQII